MVVIGEWGKFNSETTQKRPGKATKMDGMWKRARLLLGRRNLHRGRERQAQRGKMGSHVESGNKTTKSSGNGGEGGEFQQQKGRELTRRTVSSILVRSIVVGWQQYRTEQNCRSDVSACR